jgi:lipopolysaccharide transport system ATP-binding protein
LGFSVAAHLEPEILVIDEVLAVGDFEFQQKCLGKMEDVSQKEGRTVLFVSHNMEAVRNLCSHSILLKNGTVEVNDVTDVALQTYFLGDRRNNFLKIKESGIEGKGNKNIQLEEITITSDKENFTELATGTPLYIKLGFSLKTNIDFSKARIDIRIDNQYNQKIIWMSSEAKPEFDFQRGDIIFEVGSNPFLPGDYILTVYIHDGIELSDWLPSVLTFKVSNSGDLYKNLKIPSGQTSIYYPFDVL